MKTTNYKSNKSFMYNCPLMKPSFNCSNDKVPIYISKGNYPLPQHLEVPTTKGENNVNK